MKKSSFVHSLLPHFLVLVGFAILSVGYMSPILSGKSLIQSDPRSFYAAQQELRTFEKATGEWTGWTNSMFGGMPTYFIGGEYTKSVFYQIQQVLYRLLSLQGTYIFLYLLGAYLLLRALRAGLWPSVLGAIAYAFFSYNILIIEAGHLAKVYALAFAPLMLAGLALAFRGKIWLGVALFSLGVGLEINANHFQITYYSAILIGVFGIFELVRAVKNQQLSRFMAATALAVGIGLLAVATNTSRLWTTFDHTKETNRGGSELTDSNTTKGGLDKDYAYEWSYGKLESLTLLIPNFSGGASGGELDKNSQTFQALTRLGVDAGNAEQFARSMPTYWGDQLFVGGPTYAGAVVLFLLILGFFFADKRYKWPFVVSGVLCLIVSWGGNFRVFNDLLFDYLPLFNKFRAVSMIMSLMQLCIVAVAALGLANLLKNPPSWAEFKKPLLVSLAATAGIALLFALMPSLVSLTTDKDEALKSSLTQSFGNNAAAVSDVYQALVADRAALLRSDAIRSLIFILLAAAGLWAYVTNKLKNKHLIGGLLTLLVLVDLWGVDKRYLNADDFQRGVKSYDELFAPTAANQQILQDKDPHFRVIDITTGNPFQNSMASYYHHSVGGYHTVKLARYAELVEKQIAKNNMEVLNMLNTKYFIVADPQTQQPVAQQNPAALGNAWMVGNIKWVANANEEMAALDSLKPAQTAVIDRRFEKDLAGFQPSAPNGSVKLTAYQPNKLTYAFESTSPQLVVFSENYYKGNEDWISTVDGKVAPHIRANYVLRAMPVPAGKHTIEFTFTPKTVVEGQRIDWLASIGWVVFVAGALFMGYKKNELATEEA